MFTEYSLRLSSLSIYNYIKTLASRNIIKGYPDSSFKPDESLNRASAAVVIAKLLNLEPVKYDLSFTDNVPDWSKNFIMAAYKEDILRGYEDNTFRAEKPISRQEFAVIIVKALNYKYLEEKETSFSDNDKIGKWAKRYVEKAVELELIKGYEDGTFKPEEKITRAEVSVIVAKALKLIR